MARPETLDDIELENIDFATVHVDSLTTHASLLRAYATFMEACEKAGAEVTQSYNTARFSRPPTAKEQEDQLRRKQSSWDEGKKLYGHLLDIGDVEYEYPRGIAQRWAEGEGMPFPPEHDPILKPLDEVLDDIEEAVGA